MAEEGLADLRTSKVRVCSTDRPFLCVLLAFGFRPRGAEAKSTIGICRQGEAASNGCREQHDGMSGGAVADGRRVPSDEA